MTINDLSSTRIEIVKVDVKMSIEHHLIFLNWNIKALTQFRYLFKVYLLCTYFIPRFPRDLFVTLCITLICQTITSTYGNPTGENDAYYIELPNRFQYFLRNACHTRYDLPERRRADAPALVDRCMNLSIWYIIFKTAWYDRGMKENPVSSCPGLNIVSDRHVQVHPRN